MTAFDRALALLRAATGKPDAAFRPGQWDAIASIVERREKRLVVERTGWGKSIVYFIATRLLRERGAGPTLILSPLVALMRDQQKAASRMKLRPAIWNSTTYDQRNRILQDLRDDKIDILFTGPEQLANDAFMGPMQGWLAPRLGLLVVDEAHTVSDWGHNFRPDFKRLRSVLPMLPPNTPLLGTTATANRRVLDDLDSFIGALQIQRGPLARPTVALQAIRLPDYAARLAWLAETIPQLPGSGIVYTLTTRDAERVADWLRSRDISALPYHAKLSNSREISSEPRPDLEQRLLDNEVKVLVATVALGMGFDKPDLGFVIHFQMPGSIVTYYQQVGRAGRDIDRAYGVLLTGREDSDIHAYFRSTAFPDERYVSAILDALANSDGMSVNELQNTVNLPKSKIEFVLKYLSVENPSPVYKDGSTWRRTANPYQMDQETIRILTEKAEREWAEMQAYANSERCLMRDISERLDDPYADDCGICANCRSRPLLRETVSTAAVHAAAQFIKRAEQPIKPRKTWAQPGFAQLGIDGPRRIGPEHQAREGRVLSAWNDAGWGRLVVDGKHHRHFDDALVDAAAEMIETRWRPDPYPTWVTYVPSRRSGSLVPDFAQRLANRLGLPLDHAVEKVADNAPQKMQENSAHRCRNLDGVFAVTRRPPLDGPVLLVDDILDSGWTFTVIAALLREAGSGEVLPFALAASTSGN